MPKTPTKSTVAKRESTQPYPSSSPVSGSSDTKDEANDQKLKASWKGTKGSAWTGDEQKQLLHFALNRNGRGWGEAVPGKTATQAWSILDEEDLAVFGEGFGGASKVGTKER